MLFSRPKMKTGMLLIERIEDDELIGCRNIVFQPELVVRKTI